MLSSGAKAWLLGPQRGTSGTEASTSVRFGTNVDAADPAEDLAAGQSETAIAGAGDRVLAAWNDATAFLVLPATRRQASFTGVGFSSDGGATYRDLKGLPNNNPDQQWAGDPTVVAIDGGSTFIVGSLYFPSLEACSDGKPSHLTIAVSVGRVSSTGTGIAFGSPVVVAPSGPDFCKLFQRRPPANIALLDKPFMQYNGRTRTLALSYTRFFITGSHSGNGQIEVVRAHVPTNPSALSAASFSAPIIVAPESPIQVNQGSYPAVAPNGDVYVSWERNWISNLFNGMPRVFIKAARIPSGSRMASRVVTVSLNQVNSLNGGVKSLDAVAIAGYNRGLGNDFPRIAFDAPLGKVVVEWNDASLHFLGDIWMKALSPSLSDNAALHPVKVNDDSDFTLHFLPAVSVRSDGRICSSWYDRRRFTPDSAFTDYYGECRTSAGTNGADFRITTGATDWTNTSSLIIPNFGDYTDNDSTGVRTYYLWTDGRLGVPQPFSDRSGV
jgi:hypothetical protein